jgi:hypothetical protein
MGIQQTLRNLQDRARNAGWRIQWIPWQEPGRPEYVYNTPLTLITGLGGAALFVGSIILIPLAMYREDIVTLESEEELILLIGTGLAGLAIAIAGRIHAAFRKQADWEQVTAKCIDREIKEYLGGHNGRSEVTWEYRLLCAFMLDGREYTVTPEPSHMMSFTSEESVRKYLDERIDPDGACQLWIDRRNPLHAVFHKKQRI